MTEDRGAFKTNQAGLRPISVNCDVPSRLCKAVTIKPRSVGKTHWPIHTPFAATNFNKR
jgi:hypothetical protein